jgi:hypothetical protein
VGYGFNERRVRIEKNNLIGYEVRSKISDEIVINFITLEIGDAKVTSNINNKGISNNRLYYQEGCKEESKQRKHHQDTKQIKSTFTITI